MVVENEYGVKFEFEVAKKTMDSAICKELDKTIMPCSEQEYFNAYAAAHEEKWEEEWELAAMHPCG